MTTPPEQSPPAVDEKAFNGLKDKYWFVFESDERNATLLEMFKDYESAKEKASAPGVERSLPVMPNICHAANVMFDAFNKKIEEESVELDPIVCHSALQSAYVALLYDIDKAQPPTANPSPDASLIEVVLRELRLIRLNIKWYSEWRTRSGTRARESLKMIDEVIDTLAAMPSSVQTLNTSDSCVQKPPENEHVRAGVDGTSYVATDEYKAEQQRKNKELRDAVDSMPLAPPAATKSDK